MSETILAGENKSFAEELKEQWWDDHRFYHQSYVNQALHLFSALCFLLSYALLPVNLVAAVYLGGVLALWSRQIGHFFFEPKGFDNIHDMTHQAKEEIKVGFNLQRKVILFVAWALAPIALAFPGVNLAVAELSGTSARISNLAYVWFAIGIGGLLARTVYLMVTRRPQVGLVWMTKIFLDPFHDVMLYHRAPLALLQGKRFDTMARDTSSQ